MLLVAGGELHRTRPLLHICIGIVPQGASAVLEFDCSPQGASAVLVRLSASAVVVAPQGASAVLERTLHMQFIVRFSWNPCGSCGDASSSRLGWPLSSPPRPCRLLWQSALTWIAWWAYGDVFVSSKCSGISFCDGTYYPERAGCTRRQ